MSSINNNSNTTTPTTKKASPTFASCLFGPTGIPIRILPSFRVEDSPSINADNSEDNKDEESLVDGELNEKCEDGTPPLQSQQQNKIEASANPVVIEATPPNSPMKPNLPLRPSKQQIAKVTGKPPRNNNPSTNVRLKPTNTSTEPVLTSSVSSSPQKPHVINLQELRRLTAQGVPEDSSHRPLAWRILLHYLPLDTSQWQSTLDRDRNLYRNLVEELFVFSEDEPFEKEGSALRGMGWKRRDQTPKHKNSSNDHGVVSGIDAAGGSKHDASKTDKKGRRRGRSRVTDSRAHNISHDVTDSAGTHGGMKRLDSSVSQSTAATNISNTGMLIKMDKRSSEDIFESDNDEDHWESASTSNDPNRSQDQPLNTNSSLSSSAAVIERGIEVLTVKTSSPAGGLKYPSSSRSASMEEVTTSRRPMIVTDDERRAHLDKAISAVRGPKPKSSTEDFFDGSDGDEELSTSRSEENFSLEEEREWEKMAQLIPNSVKEEWKSTGRDVASLFAGLGAKRKGKRIVPGGRFLNALLIHTDFEENRVDSTKVNCENEPSSAREEIASALSSGSQQHQEQSNNTMDGRWSQIFENASLLDEIRKDVVRTHPDLRFFLEPQDNVGLRRYAALERILFVWAKLNKGVRYVQGMNEIVGTMFFVLANDTNEEWAREAEADTYFLFNTLMVEMRDIFVPDLDEADTGIQGRMSHMLALLSLHDPEVRCHLDDCGIDPAFYSIRWLTTLLSREFYLPDTIRLWDSMFASTHKDNFMRYVCVSMVMIIREELLKGDFGTCLRLLQKYPPTNIDQLLEASRALWIYESQVTLACHKGGISLSQALATIAPPPAVVMAYGLSGGMATDEDERIRNNVKQQQRQRRRSPAPRSVQSRNVPKRRGSFGSISSMGSKSLFAGFFGIGKKNPNR